MNRFALISGASLSFLAIALGAFGAHAIADIVSPERLNTWHTAARYLSTQGLALLAIGILSIQLKQPLKRPTLLIFTGVCVFCATLFGLVLSGITLLGAIAPLGGVLMLAGWLELTYTLIIRLPAEA